VKDFQRVESGDFIVFGEEYSATMGPTEELLGSHVDVTIAAEADATLPKKPKAAS
jgi:hypothetical protein